MNYADKIKTIRKQLGLTQTEFAELIGAKRGNIGQIEAGNTKPTLDVIRQIVKNTNIDYDYFFNDNDSVFNTSDVNLNVNPNVNPIRNIKAEEESINYEGRETATREEINRLRERIQALQERMRDKQALIDEKEQRIKELNKYIEMLETYQSGQSIGQKKKAQ